MNPLFLASSPPYFSGGQLLLPTAPYYGAGQTTQTNPGIPFTFHQFCFANGLAYDPSVRSALVGDPFMSMTLTTYLNSAFPGQVAAGFNSQTVPTISIGNVQNAPFVFTGVTPNSASVGTTVTATINGAGFISTSPVLLTLVEVGGTTPIPDGTITRGVTTQTTISTVITINAGATQRTIEILGLRAIPGMSVERGRAPFNMIP